ncbi:MAG TPA: ABC transporter substrate-binding protein [Solirubrobacteraceae bacterium]|nr:ABC transporter substrate-binding protein [Solirubrobacteraceae bacterium]
MQRILDHFVFRRATVVALVVCALGLTAAAGVGTAATPRKGGTLTFALDRDAGCVDPQQSPWSTVQITSRPVLDSLIVRDPKTGDFKPWLATKWKISDNARTFTFTLRRGVTFSDGKPLNAAAVKANFDRIVNPATKSTFSLEFLAGYRGTSIKGDTLTVHFEHSNSGFLNAASTAFLGIESPATFAAGPAATCQKIVGSGPYTLTSYTPQKGMTLTRRPGYAWGPATAANKGVARLDKIDFRILPENGVRVASLKNGDVDAIANVPPRQVPSLKRSGATVLRKLQPGLPYSLVLNQQRAPFNQINARKAVRAAIDQDAISKSIYQLQYPAAHGVIGHATPGYDKSFDKLKSYDPKLANKLLDGLGYTKRDGDGYRVKDGKRLTIDWPVLTPAQYQRDVVAQLIQQQLKAIGIQAVLRPVPVFATTSLRASGNYGLLDPQIIRGDPSIISSASGTTSIGRVANKQLQALLTEGRQTIGTAKRNAVYAKAQKVAYDTVQWISVVDVVYLLGQSKKVNGITFDAEGYPQFYDAWLAG